MSEGTVEGESRHAKLISNVDDASLNEEAKHHLRVFDFTYEQVIVLLDVCRMQALQTLASCDCCFLLTAGFIHTEGQ